MSIGKSKQKSSSQSTTTQALDPQIKAALLNNVGTAQTAAASLTPFSGQRVAGFNPTQTSAQQGLLDVAGQHVGSGLLDTAAKTASAAAAYHPANVSTSPLLATQATAAPDVNTSGITADQINGYLNPYTDAVVNTTNADLDRQRQIEQVNNAAQATKAHAFGGTGAAVLSGLTNDNYARTTASTDAGLRQAGYNTALSAAQQDAARRLQADQGNQGAANQVGIFNAGATNTAAAQSAANDLAAQTANQTAAGQANGQSLTAAGLLGQLSDQQRTQAVGDVGLLGQVGDAQQAQQQKELQAALDAHAAGQQLTVQQQTLINQALALLGNSPLTTSQSTGTGSGSSFSLTLPPPPP